MELEKESLDTAIFLAEGSITTLIEVAQESNKWKANIFKSQWSNISRRI